MKKVSLLFFGLLAAAQNALAVVISPEQTTALTGAVEGGVSEYFTVLIAFAIVVIPVGIVVGLIWKFIPRVKGRGL